MSEVSTSLMGEPTAEGRFGEFGGRFVPETLIPACFELEAAFRDAWGDWRFRGELDAVLRDYAGRPSILTECHNLGGELGLRLLLKREDLNHTGSHKINNVLGQALLATRMGKSRLVAETGAGQHGVATATAAALFGLECKVYMGAVDMARQELNVFRMRLLGAEVEAVDSGSRTLKDAVNEALRDWVATVGDTHYCIGSVMGPHPYPWMVRELQRVVGDEAREQCRALLGGDPDVVVACVGGGSNAAGIFSGFVDGAARLVGVEPAGGAAVGRGVPGVVHGMRSYLMQDEYGQVEEAHSVSAGLDYPGVGPEHSFLGSIGRAEYPPVTDDEVLAAFALLARREGILAAFEPAHALAWVVREAPVARRTHGARQPVRPRRQGRRPGDGADDRLMARMEQHLRTARDGGRKLLVPYITGGYPGWEDAVRAAAAAGADGIEIGIPFSDPVMDGPVIQQASQAALDAGANPPAILDAVGGLDVGIPLAVMTYYNLVHHDGHRRFAGRLVAAGVDACILPDLPLEESAPWCRAADEAGVETVMLAAPTAPAERLPRIVARARGFVYSVGLLGVTGERAALAATATELAGRLKAITDLPVLVGVGVSNADQAREACRVADGVVQGASVVRRLMEQGPDAVGAYVAEVRAALDALVTELAAR